jgi:hypothetical protein
MIDVRGQRVETKVGNCLAYLSTAYMAALQIVELDQRLSMLEAQQEVVARPQWAS